MLNYIVFIRLYALLNKPKFLIGIALSLISTFISLIIPTFIGDSLDTELLLKLSQQKTILFEFILLLIIIYSLQGFSNYLISHSGNEAIVNLQKEFFRHILSLKIINFENYKSGDLTSRLVNDTLILSKLIAIVFPQLLFNSILIIGSIFFLFTISPYLLMISLVLIPFLCLLLIPVNQFLEKKYQHQQHLLGQISGDINHKLSNIRLIKSYLGQEQEVKFVSNRINNFTRNFNLIIKTLIVQGTMTKILVFSGIIGLLLTASSEVQTGKITVGQLTSFIIYFFQLLSPITSLSEIFSELSEIKGTAQRLEEIFKLSLEETDKPSEMSLSGDIKFENLEFSYPNTSILWSMEDFILPKGKHLAIVGSSGSGKSTLFSILLKYIIHYNGNIYLNKHELRQLSPQVLREKIAYIPQISHFFHGTIRENLTYGKNYQVTEEEILDILKHLDLIELIEQLPHGLETVIGERGEGLSEGQKQRLSIARALLSSSDILLFDETTANLDRKTEEVLMAKLATLYQNKTVLTIAHRWEAIKEADYFLTIRNGKATFYSHKEFNPKKYNLI